MKGAQMAKEVRSSTIKAFDASGAPEASPVASEVQLTVPRRSSRLSIIDNTDSVFFRSHAEAVAAPFIAHLTHRCVAPDDFSADANFTTWSDEVALVFVDISGYSKLASALSGAHALAEAVNGYFKPIVEIVLEFGGDILKFAGDAMMVIWPVTQRRTIQRCCHEALACAMKLQKTCGSHEVPQADATLKLHIGVTAGRMEAEVFMPKTTSKPVMQRAYFFVGGPVLRTLDVVVDGTPSGFVGTSIDVQRHVDTKIVKYATPKEGSASEDAQPASSVHIVESVDFAAVDAVRQAASMNRSQRSSVSLPTSPKAAPSDTSPSDEDDESDIEGDVEARGKLRIIDEYFVPPTILNRLRMGLRTQDMAEMRHLYCLFIQKTGDMDITDWFDEVYEILNAGRCPITQVIEDDKGVHVIAAMNLYVAEEGAADAAVQVAQQLVRREVSCIVGIAGGSCFCGIVGSEQVCRWDITGAPCVRACRLMQYASAEGFQVAIDVSLAEGAKDASALRMQCPEVTIKGSSHPVPVFTLRQQTDTAMNSIAAMNDFTLEVRASDRNRIRRELIDRDDIICGSTLVVGPANAGKKYLLLSSIHSTPFTPLLHRTMRECSKLDVCRSIAEWFEYHSNDELRSLATMIRQAQLSQHTSKAMQLTLELIQLSIDLGQHTAIVVDRTQYLDDASLRLVKKSTRLMNGQGTPRNPGSTVSTPRVRTTPTVTSSTTQHAKGRWIWLFSMSPLLNGQSTQRIQSLGGVTNVSVLGKLTLDELQALMRYFSFYEKTPEMLALYENTCNCLLDSSWVSSLSSGRYSPATWCCLEGARSKLETSTLTSLHQETLWRPTYAASSSPMLP